MSESAIPLKSNLMALLVLTAVVTVHEFGHLMAAVLQVRRVRPETTRRSASAAFEALHSHVPRPLALPPPYLPPTLPQTATEYNHPRAYPQPVRRESV